MTAPTPYLTTTEAAELARRSPAYIAKQCKEGAIRATKVGEWRIHRDDLDDFLRGGTPVPRKREPRRRAS